MSSSAARAFSHKVPLPANWDAMSSADSLAPPAPASTITTAVTGVDVGRRRRHARERPRRAPEPPIREASCERDAPSPRGSSSSSVIRAPQQPRSLFATPLFIWTIGLVLLTLIAGAVFVVLKVQNERRRIQASLKAKEAQSKPLPRDHPSIVDTIKRLTSPPGHTASPSAAPSETPPQSSKPSGSESPAPVPTPPKQSTPLPAIPEDAKEEEEKDEEKVMMEALIKDIVDEATRTEAEATTPGAPATPPPSGNDDEAGLVDTPTSEAEPAVDRSSPSSVESVVEPEAAPTEEGVGAVEEL